VAFAHHDTALGNQGGGAKAVHVGPQQGGDDHVPAGAQAAVGLHRNPPPQAVEHQGLMGLGQADLPGGAGVVDGGHGAGAGAAVVAGNGDMIGVGLGHPGGDGADADLGYQLDADLGLGVDIFSATGLTAERMASPLARGT
jgi:hypothetical protein